MLLTSILLLSNLAFADAIIDTNPTLVQKLQQRRQDRIVIENRMNNSNLITTQTSTTSQSTTTVANITTATSPKVTLPPPPDNGGTSICYQNANSMCTTGFEVISYDYNNASSNPKPYKCCKSGSETSYTTVSPGGGGTVNKNVQKY